MVWDVDSCCFPNVAFTDVTAIKRVPESERKPPPQNVTSFTAGHDMHIKYVVSIPVVFNGDKPLMTDILVMDRPSGTKGDGLLGVETLNKLGATKFPIETTLVEESAHRVSAIYTGRPAPQPQWTSKAIRPEQKTLTSDKHASARALTDYFKDLDPARSRRLQRRASPNSLP
jgi:hypothetical protein